MADEPDHAKGTDFPESVKREARRLAIFKCCICRDVMGDHVHHLKPKEEGGQGVIENAILLCVRCHDLYGHRSDKRAQLTQARDLWHEHVRQKYSVSALNLVEDVATKTDVNQILNQISNLAEVVRTNVVSGKFTTQDAA